MSCTNLACKESAHGNVSESSVVQERETGALDTLGVLIEIYEHGSAST
jgi:hypothetical protein